MILTLISTENLLCKLYTSSSKYRSAARVGCLLYRLWSDKGHCGEQIFCHLVQQQHYPRTVPKTVRSAENTSVNIARHRKKLDQ